MEDLAMEERLDMVMDKAIRRLAQAKPLKQVSGIRMIENIAFNYRTGSGPFNYI
jgi:hypothetical protein